MAVFTVKRGTTWQLGFRWTINGSPLPMAGSSAELHVRTKHDVLLLSASSDTGELVITPSTGQVDLTVSASAMADVPVGKHNFDMKLTLASGRVLATDTNILVVVKDETHD